MLYLFAQRGGGFSKKCPRVVKFCMVLMRGRAEGCACTDPIARTSMAQAEINIINIQLSFEKRSNIFSESLGE